VDIKKSVSIIIPNYNGRHLLEAYLPYTISAIENAGAAYEFIVVDDASTDDSVEFMKAEYPQITLLVNTANRGFSYSCNRGIEAAKCELILLLNSDVKLTPDYFSHQWKYFALPDTFGVMGRIIDMEGDHIQDAARIPKFNGLKLKTAYFYYTDNENDWLYTFYLSGANALIDAAKLKQTGGFYELFSPFYCEDMELSIRAWKLNWKCYYEHQAICRHRVSASTKNYKTAQWVKSIYYRNRFYLHALHLNGWALFGWYIQITLIDLLPKLLTGQFWIWKSYRELFKNSDLIKGYKSRVKELLRKNDSRLTIFNIVGRIRLSVKDKELVRIKL
jgi:GT2 family glycosyltransferase